MPGRPVLAGVFSCRSLTRACSKPFECDFQACGPSSMSVRTPRTPQRWFSRPARMSASTGPASFQGMISQVMGQAAVSSPLDGLNSGFSASSRLMSLPWTDCARSKSTTPRSDQRRVARSTERTAIALTLLLQRLADNARWLRSLRKLSSFEKENRSGTGKPSESVYARLPTDMHTRLSALSILLLSTCLQTAVLSAQPAAAPHLEKKGAAIQLIVDGKPFLILGGELHNSSSSSLEYMKPLWPKLAAMGLNTVITPLSWELIEPKEGSYDFTLVDGLLAQARPAHERIVFLWLPPRKNVMSSYAPVWVKQDTRRFPRVVERGNEVEVLSPQAAATQEADARAYAALMQH